LGKFLKDFSADQIVAWSLFGIDFTLVTFLISLTRIFFIGRVIWCGVLSSFVMVSSSIADSWDGYGWQTDARCFAKAMAFCLSVRAQDTDPPMKMEQTECFETSTYKIQTPGHYPEESTHLFTTI